MTGATISPDKAALMLFGVFFALMVIRVPAAFALGLACLPVMFIEPRLSPLILSNETVKSCNSFILLAVPFFLLTANLMNVGGITDRLARLSRDLVGHLPGGLAQVNVVLSIFFADISGSSTADAASQDKLFIEAQVKEGCDLSFSVAITAVSAVLAVIIPPSSLMIFWGGTLQVSIGALFLAGILPGLLLGAVQMATVHVYAKLRNHPNYPRSNLKKIFSALPIAVSALMTPVIIIIGTILEPLARSAGMDPAHFAMVGIPSLAFGPVTPPYGLCLMISCAIAKVRLMYMITDDHVPAEADLAGNAEVAACVTPAATASARTRAPRCGWSTRGTRPACRRRSARCGTRASPACRRPGRARARWHGPPRPRAHAPRRAPR
jgi:TRAP-type mannitol/chloroaromatic compound transport system permease large subunit